MAATPATAQRIPPAAAWLGYGGLVPFAAASLACWGGGDVGVTAATLYQGYSAVILAFLGGIPWGLALRDPVSAERLGLGVLPPLIAWVGLALPPAGGITVLGLALAAFYAWDRRRNLADVPAWFRRLRRDLTAGAVLTHVVAVAGVL